MDINTRSKSKEATKGIVGSPKKGGAGGKGAWGKGGIDDLVTVKVKDSGDPNYDSEEDEVHQKENVVMTKVEVNSPIEAILNEYFIEADIQDTIRKVKEVSSKDFSYSDFVRKAMERSMERQPYERELVSKLLSGLYGNMFSARVMADGFQYALDNLDDTILDIPTAGEMLGKFIARGILDEIIPPAFLKTAWSESSIASDALALANGMVTDNHRSKKLEHVWGPGDLESVKRLKSEASQLVAEYLITGDKAEADQCVRRLNAPSFHFQLVWQAVRMALSANSDDRKKILDLLAFFHKTGLIVPDQISQGFKMGQGNLEDIKLDIPTAPANFLNIVQIAQQDGWLSRDFK